MCNAARDLINVPQFSANLSRPSFQNLILTNQVGALRSLITRAIRTAVPVALIATAAVAYAQDVTTWHYDIARSGVQSHETILTPSNVNRATFGKVFSFPVLGDVYAQPLYLSQYTMSDGLAHNVLIVATAEDYVYAFDADGKNPSQGYLWRRSMLASGETWVSYNDVHVTDIKPNIGIIGTPVINRTSGIIYFVAKSKTTSGTVSFIQRLHALNIADGTEKLNGPTVIQATVPGLGDSGTTVSFNPHLNNQRPALLLAPTPGVGSGSSVFIGWASHGDLGHYHGWFMAYDAANIAQQNGAWSATPNGTDGGIWQSGGGASSDGAGNIYFASGNGTFDASSGGNDYGDSAFQMTLGASGFVVQDYFTPGDQNRLDSSDNDMGTAAVTLLPTQSGSIPHLMITADKSGMIYLLNRDHLGYYTTPGDSSLQNFGDGGYSIHSGFAFFNNVAYLGPDNGHLQAWTFNPTTERFATTAQSRSSALFGCSGCNPTGSTPSISANGTSNAIVWALDNSHYYNDPPVLHAYDPANLQTEYYNTTQAANNRDAATIAIKFTTPTIANGRVYVGARNAVTVYGLLSNSEPVTAAPTFSPPAGTYTGTQSVSLADATANASIYYTTDADPTQSQWTLYSAPIKVASSETIEAYAIAPSHSQSVDSSAAYTIKTAGGTSGQTEVSLSSSANIIGIYTDGTKYTTGGFNGVGCAYSEQLLGGSITFSGISYALGNPNQKNVVKGTKAPTIELPADNYSTLKFLAAAVIGNQKTTTFTVTYTDGSAQKFSQGVSDWITPQHYAGESIALASSYCDTSSGGRTTSTHNIYQYSLGLNNAKTVKSLTLPSDADVELLAITLVD